MDIDYKALKKFRQSLGYKQIDVANELGYSLENISKFENGKNNNLKIYLWYIEKGFDKWQESVE